MLAPSDMKTDGAVQNELQHVRALLQLEQKEDQTQFKLKNASASIKERRRRGLTWYPVTITQEDIGFGGKVVLELERPAHLQDLHLFQVGKNACVFSNAPGYSGPDRPVLSGVVTSVRRNKLLLATTQERDIIAITLTRSNPQGEIGFLSDIRRMNVGMTRARRKLLLVGDSSTLCSHPFFGELLAYVKGVGGYRTANEVGKQGRNSRAAMP
jgi:hypothetical protein